MNYMHSIINSCPPRRHDQNGKDEVQQINENIAYASSDR